MSRNRFFINYKVKTLENGKVISKKTVRNILFLNDIDVTQIQDAFPAVLQNAGKK